MDYLAQDSACRTSATSCTGCSTVAHSQHYDFVRFVRFGTDIADQAAAALVTLAPATAAWEEAQSMLVKDWTRSLTERVAG
jgi:hypothetical protein